MQEWAIFTAEYGPHPQRKKFQLCCRSQMSVLILKEKGVNLIAYLGFHYSPSKQKVSTSLHILGVSTYPQRERCQPG